MDARSLVLFADQAALQRNAPLTAEDLLEIRALVRMEAIYDTARLAGGAHAELAGYRGLVERLREARGVLRARREEAARVRALHGGVVEDEGIRRT